MYPVIQLVTERILHTKSILPEEQTVLLTSPSIRHSRIPLVGDWDGDGDDTVGIYRNSAFYLRNSNTAGPADLAFNYGIPGDTQLVGDWEGW